MAAIPSSAGIYGPCDWCLSPPLPRPVSPYDQAARDWEEAARATLWAVV